MFFIENGWRLMFHETKENIMFKKTLLALAVAGVSVTANAATIYTTNDAKTVAQSEADLKTTTPAAGDALGVDGIYFNGTGGPGAADDNCAAAAKALSVTLDETNFKHDGKDTNKATFATQAGTATGITVEMTAVDACTVTYPAVLGKTVKKDGIEYSTVQAIEVKAEIVAGIGGYKDEDTITIDLTGAKVDLTKTTAPKISIDVAGIKKVSAGAPAATDITFDVLDISANQVRFTVQSSTPGDISVAPNAILSLSGIKLDSSDLSTETTVALSSFATNTSGTDFDPASAATVTSLVPQYTAEVVTAYDALIDVAQDRQTFSTSDTDALTFKVTKQTTGLELTPATMSYVLDGDFSWFANKAVDTNEDGKYSSAEIGAWVTATDATGYAVNADLNQLTVTATTATPDTGNRTISIKVPGFDDGKLENPVIPVQSFDVAVSVQDNKAFSTKAVNMVATTATDAGAWELNGSVIYVPYVPFGPNTQPILRHTNKGTRTGDITVRYMVEGEHTEWQSLSAANVADAKPGVRNMLGLVTDALKGEGYDATKAGFKVALEIVTNVPARDVFVYGGVKVSAEGQDRIHLITTKDND